MAARFAEIGPIEMDPIEVRINACFDELVLALNRRREELLAEYRNRREEMRAKEIGRAKTKQQLIQTKAHVQETMVENLLHALRERMTEDIETQLRNFEVTCPPVELMFQCEMREMTETISQLGQIVQKKQILPPVPDYPSFSHPYISVCEKGKGPGQLNTPTGIAFCEDSHLIYVADFSNLNSRLCVFSEEGEYVESFGQKQLTFPFGVAISGANIYISDVNKNSIFRFTFPKFLFVSVVGGLGSGNNKFCSPFNVSVAGNSGDVYVADKGNDRIVIMDCELKFKQSIRHSTMTGPIGVKLLNGEVYVLSETDNPCLHVFSRTGNKIRSFVTQGKGGRYQVERGHCFCFDRKSNILIGDRGNSCIKVFSPSGALLHTLGVSQEEDKKINPQGILVTPDNKIVCSSIDTKFRLHIFC